MYVSSLHWTSLVQRASRLSAGDGLLSNQARRSMTTMFNTGDMPSRLEGWYVSQCNGMWEHAHGFTLGTIDNPGWTLTVDLAETE